MNKTGRAVNNSAMALFELPSGMLSERLGERSLLVFGLFCAGCGYLSLAVASGLAVIVLSLFVAGFGAAFQHALSSSIISNSFQGTGSRTALGAYNSSGDIGKLTFTALFSLALGMGIAWQGVVAGFGSIALLGAAALFIILRRLNVGGRSSTDAQTRVVSGSSGWGIRDPRGFTALAVIVFLA
jgi:MFS family permease